MKKTLSLLFASLLLFIWSCRKDFIVENIDKKTVTVNSPANNTVTTVNLISFWWEELNGAEKYNLQIVKPSFANAVSLLVDTNVTTNKFNFNLKPGTYQWRIKATNAGHSTAYQTYDIRVDTTSDLTEQFVNLISPINNSISGNKVTTFTWGTITVAKKYRVQITSATSLVLDTTLIAKTSLTYTLPAAKSSTTAYSWNVKAINDASESQFNTNSYTLTIDLKGPGVPIPTTPLIGTLVTNTDSLRWTHATDTKYDSVYVADDSLFQTNLVQLWYNVNKAAIAEFNKPASPVGSYYWWKIRSFDLFGNPSSYSAVRKFKIGP